MNELKPCPFCGGQVHITKGYVQLHTPSRNGYCVECYECQLQFGHDCDYGGIYSSPETAIDDWNKRIKEGEEQC